jgi:hypothetical protein
MFMSQFLHGGAFMLTVKTLVTAACYTLATTTMSFAAPVDFNFSFTDGANTITGLIEGLDRDGLSQEPSRITVYGILDTYVFEYQLSNSFDVSNSVLDTSTLDLFISLSSYPDFGAGPFAELVFFGNFPSFGWQEAAVQGTLIQVGAGAIEFSPVPAVNLPSGGVLLLSALGGIAAFKRHKKRAA